MGSVQLHSVKETSGNTDLTIQGVRILGSDEKERRTLQLLPGTITVILGPNGVGKSHFLEQLAGLRKPERLSIRYGDQPLWLPGRMTASRLRLNPQALLYYGYASQFPEEGLFLRSVEEEIRYSQRPYAAGNPAGDMSSTQRVDAALEAVGWDRSWLDRNPLRMSGGERRRVALAALFSTPAAWLLLDEPTAGLDRDGHDRLASHLAKLKQCGTGILMISHEADWALPLADRVLLFHADGRLRDCDPLALIAYPHWLSEAGLTVPIWLTAIRKSGLAHIQPEAWRHPLAVAEALVPHLKQGLPADPARPAIGLKRANDSLYASNPPASMARNEPSVRRSLLNRFDPRAIWLGYVLLSVGLFSLSSWAGLAAGAGIVILLLMAARIPLARWRGILGGFAVFGTALSAGAAISLSPHAAFPLTWETSRFLGTLFPFVRTFIVMLIGLGVPMVMTPLSLRRALEQLVPRKRRVPVVWQQIVLTITLTIRFVPVLLNEWERFGRIFLARGKEIRWSPGATIRRLKGIAMPLILALFRLADEVAIALESRGIRKDIRPTRTERLKWGWPDTMMTGGAALLAALLWLAD